MEGGWGGMWGCPCMVFTLPLFTAFLAALLSETGGCQNYVLPFYHFVNRSRFGGGVLRQTAQTVFVVTIREDKTFIWMQCFNHMWSQRMPDNGDARSKMLWLATANFSSTEKCARFLSKTSNRWKLYAWTLSTSFSSNASERFNTKHWVRTAKPNVSTIVVCRLFQNLSIGR